MAKLPQQKLKIIYLMKILIEKTDEEHPMTIKQMIQELANYGISSERKSIYDDLENLKLFGLDVVSRRGKSYEYFVGSRDFELPELTLLIDSVQCTKFITYKKSLELISKIEKLTSRYNAKKIHNQVNINNRVKTMNESIYYNIDSISNAINSKKKIEFKYFQWDINKQKVMKKDGENYCENPIFLTLYEENYYLIVYNENHNSFVHYRVDKMSQICVTDKPAYMPKTEFNTVEYSKKMFSMFGGEETTVTVEFENSLIGVVIDRFGIEIPITTVDENHFITKFAVAISSHFFSWIISFGNKAKLISPENVKLSICELLKNSIDQYE